MAIDWNIRDKHIVAVGLLTADDLARLGPSFELAWPVEHSSCFDRLLQAIDDADGAVGRERDRAEIRD